VWVRFSASSARLRVCVGVASPNFMVKCNKLCSTQKRRPTKCNQMAKILPDCRQAATTKVVATTATAISRLPHSQAGVQGGGG